MVLVKKKAETGKAASAFFHPEERLQNERALQGVKAGVRMIDVCTRYGVEVRRGRFALCPFHAEGTPSMKVYDNDFHCFGCGAHGDVIAFVRRLFNLSFPETLRKIDNDFSLGLYKDYSVEEAMRAHFECLARQSEIERKRSERREAEEAYWRAFDEWKRLDDNRVLYQPKPGEIPHPAFVESLQKLDYQKHILDCLDERRREYD